MTEHQEHIFKPVRIQISVLSAILFVAIVITAFYCINGNTIIMYFLLIVLIGMFLFMFIPLLKKPKSSNSW